MDSVTRDSAQPSFGERRGHRLAPLNTDFSRPSSAHLQAHSSRLQRPRPTDYPSINGTEGPVPLQSPVKRQSSKSSLRSLFSRDKLTRAATAPDSKLAEIEEAQQTTAQTVTVPDTPLSSGLWTTASTPTLASPTTPRARATLKTARTPPVEPKPPSKEQYGWKPPPLLQAYPQAIKHECLSAPAMSADSILRLHATRNKSGAEDGRPGKPGHDESAHAMRKKKEQKERKHLRTLSGTINKVEWSKKIYVLATAGFILQYAGEGKNDRLPEKMLQLGPQSVAFASDAIPGKHWVLQISRDPAADAGPAPPEPPKPKFARFGFHRSPARRLTRSFLLVFDNPDTMISWLMAVRAEIEARGGPKFTAEKHSDEGPEPQLRSKSSVRQMVKKDPHRVSSLFLQPQNLGVPNEDDGQSVGGLTWPSRRSSYVSDSRRSIIESRAGSMASTGRTEAISTTPSDAWASSFTSANNPPSSPPAASGPFVLDEPRSPGADSAYARSPPSSSHGNFQSPYTSAKPQVIPTATRTGPVQASSPSFVPDPLIRSASPPAPNFSVPLFSKKFASRPGPFPVSQGSPSVDGVLLREGSTTDFSTSNASSPPVSPTYSVASSRFTDSSEPSMLPHDGTGRRTLRAFNSEDALSRMVRSGNTASTAPNSSRVPRGTAQPSEYSESASHPPSMAGRSGLGIQLNNAPGVPITSQVIPSPPAESGPRSRLSTAQTDSQPQSVSRRKSMPGLVIGAPTAPPPNCPLPKIPPIARQAPPPLWSSSPEGNDRSQPSSPAHEHAQDRRKSGMVPGMPTHQPSSGGLRSADRQSRIPQ